MAVNVPVTIWQPTPGNGEMATQGVIDLVTLAGVFIITLAGAQVILGSSTYTKIPTTVWVEDDGE